MKKPVAMSLSRPSKAGPTAKEPQAKVEDVAVPAPNVPAPEPAEVNVQPTPVAAPPPPRPVAPPARSAAGAARLEQGVKRIVVDVAPSVHRQVKVRSVDYSGGIKEYILRLLEADGIDLSDQPDFVPRPK